MSIRRTGTLTAILIAFAAGLFGTLGFQAQNRAGEPPPRATVSPRLSYFTYLGGRGSDEGMSVAAGSGGDVYVCGRTDSTDFPVLAAQQEHSAPYSGLNLDGFLSRFSGNGATLAYSTYLDGACLERSTALAIDDAGNAYAAVACRPEAARAGGGSVFGVDPAGRLLYKTRMLIPMSEHGITWGTPLALAVGPRGTLYVACSTARELQNGLPPIDFDIIVVLLDRAGKVINAAVLGGSDEEVPHAIAVDDAGTAWVAGMTRSGDFPIVGGSAHPGIRRKSGADRFEGDAFVARMDLAKAQLLFSICLGGGFEDSAEAIAIDKLGQIYVAGETASRDFPVFNPIQASRAGRSDAFVVKLGAEGSHLLSSTYLGGSKNDSARTIAVDGDGVVWLAGVTDSPDFPLPPAQARPGCDGSSCPWAYVAALSPGGNELLWSTGFSAGKATAVGGIAVAPSGSLYVIGTTSTEGLATPQAFQAKARTLPDAFLARFDR